MYIKKYIFIFLLLPLLTIINSCGGGGGGIAGTEAGKPVVSAAIIKGQLSYSETSQSAPSKSISKAPSDNKISNVKIQLENSILSTYSDTDGRFEIKNVPVGEHTIVAEFSDEIKMRMSNINVTRTAGQDVGTAELQQTGKIIGKAKLTDSNNYSGITVFVLGTNYSSITNPGGHFLIKGVPVTTGSDGNSVSGYTVVASKSAYEAFKVENVQVLPNRANRIDTEFVLQPTTLTGAITGSVVLEDTTDFYGITVSIKNTSYSDTTDSSGIYEITGIPVGSYHVEASKKGYRNVTIVNVPVDPNDTFNVVTIFLNKDGLEDSDGDGIADSIDQDDDNDGFSDNAEDIAGTDPKDPFSYPTGKIKGYINPTGASAIVYAKLDGLMKGFALTDTAGFYRIEDLPSGTYSITVKATGYIEAETDNIYIQAGYLTNIPVITLTPTVKTGMITGTALLYNQSIHSGITITVQSCTAQTTTNSNGEFSLTGINEGFYTIVMTSPGYREKVIYNVLVSGDETIILSAVTLIPVQGTGGILTGTAKLENADNHGSILIVIEGTSKIAITDSSGSYTINDIPAGDTVYTVTAIKLNYNETSSQVVISSGQTTIQNFELTAIPIADLDGDGIPDHIDSDKDGDGVLNGDDEFASDSTEWSDLDGDNIGDNSDTDMDNDGYSDSSDAFPRDRTEWFDSDNDGIGNNSDADDDNDGYTDVEENQYGTDPENSSSYPSNILSLNTDDTEINKNYLFEVKVYAKGFSNIKVVYVELQYDITKLSIVSDTGGTFLGNNNGTIIYLSKEFNDTIGISASNVGGKSTAASGSGIISTIKFAALNTINETEIKIQSYSLTDSDYDEVTANTVNLKIKIK